MLKVHAECFHSHRASCGQELQNLADEKNLVIAVGYMLRYNAAIEKAKELLEEVCLCCPNQES